MPAHGHAVLLFVVLKKFQTSPFFAPTLSLTLAVFLGACSGSKKKDYTAKSPKESPTQKKSEAPPPWRQTLGRVALVNQDMSFVLVEIGTAPSPEPGAPLRAYSDTTVSAELVVSSYQRRPFLIGDIVSGMPKVGDSIVLIGNRSTPNSGPLPKDESPVRRYTPGPLPQVESRTQFLPALSNEDSASAPSRLRRSTELEPPAAPALASAPAAESSEPTMPPPAQRGAPSLPSSQKGESFGEPSPSPGAEIIPGVPVSRKRLP